MGFVIFACLAISIIGCGGGSGGNDPTSSTVAIQDFQVPANPGETRTIFFPNNTAIPAGVNSRIQWVNQTPGRHQIVSGTLVANGTVATEHLINIGNDGFSTTLLDANFGDKITFSNLSQRAFKLQVLDSNGRLVNNFDLPVGATIIQPPRVIFAGAGLYTVQDPEAQFVLTVTLSGTPQADGQFQSGILSHGDVFQAAFPVPGTFHYFDLNPDDPKHVYATGTIVVQ